MNAINVVLILLSISILVLFIHIEREFNKMRIAIVQLYEALFGKEIFQKLREAKELSKNK